MQQKQKIIFSIGHSQLHFFNFAKLLWKYQIKTLVDIRSRPYSRFAPQFNRTSLEMELSKLGIMYIFKGRNLGGKDENIDFEQNIQWLCQQARKEQNVAIMCSEAEPLKCHRHLLIEPHLKKYDVEVIHILKDGTTSQSIF